ncbi:electron transfer flavoprotein subunit alpha/FixB family protein [Pelagibacterium halotolerans]|uniref:Electron transfer flavoprotein subunit alpha n=1 Tax=Pelagibacterium halotolerans (strain DSM 22347 / JCM 15775 / CGMCC 1.7692 / B2) TaxID=1082931 RepID=G4RD23_PELHB|nr:FAD-binding protein [Pelagibacterium halotolerans]AEQ53773.1 electron transfer flavoprotein, alpha subunit [Pelagibacterium halotolerans B2]QJR20068.1 electron transfer flavoprotein subunit alpha [Pelagibacterium halotolerans]SEA80730.1 electron transfer flavoprotein alpha subunit apoprotein [Pelagibacterium halotolerans]
MAVLLLAETTDGVLAFDATARAVSAVRGLGEVTVLVCGDKEAADRAATLDGVSRVVFSSDPALTHGLVENVAELVVSRSDGFAHIAAPATTSGKAILPYVAARLDVMVITDVAEIVDAETFKRPIYAGNAIQTVRSSDRVKVFSVRTSAFAPVADGASAQVEQVGGNGDRGVSAFIENHLARSDRPDLTSAKIVVSGGRGLGSGENFALIDRLADKLGAAIGASRAAVDSGYVANDLQVGQTGKVVAPDLYIAVGISGAIQHLAGMKDSRIIVAINKDEEAPIFEIADFGLVADLFEALPELIEKL